MAAASTPARGAALWVGHPEYTASDNIQPSTAGGVIGEAIWAIMQENCIAQ